MLVVNILIDLLRTYTVFKNLVDLNCQQLLQNTRTCLKNLGSCVWVLLFHLNQWKTRSLPIINFSKRTSKHFSPIIKSYRNTRVRLERIETVGNACLYVLLVGSENISHFSKHPQIHMYLCFHNLTVETWEMFSMS